MSLCMRRLDPSLKPGSAGWGGFFFFTPAACLAPIYVAARQLAHARAQQALQQSYPGRPRARGIPPLNGARRERRSTVRAELTPPTDLMQPCSTAPNHAQTGHKPDTRVVPARLSV